jgi:hypothetical protein
MIRSLQSVSLVVYCTSSFESAGGVVPRQEWTGIVSIGAMFAFAFTDLWLALICPTLQLTLRHHACSHVVA